MRVRGGTYAASTRGFSNMTSCEPKRCSAYSDDLRWRMVWQREGLGYTYDDVAKNLCVDKSTVKRIVDRFKLSGNISKKPYPTHRAARKLILPAQLVMDQPAHYLDEIQRKLKQLLLIDVDISTICRFLHKCGFTRQKLRTVALQQDQFLRQQFMCDMSVYSTNMFIFIDETTEMHFASMDTVYVVRLQSTMHCWLEESEYLLLRACLVLVCLMSKPLLEPVMETHSMILYTLIYYHT